MLAHEPAAGRTHANSMVRGLAGLLSISSAHRSNKALACEAQTVRE